MLNKLIIGTGSGAPSSVSVFEPDRLSTGSIIGIGVGAGVGLIALVAFMILCCRCYRRRETSPRVLNHHHSSYSGAQDLAQARQKRPREVQVATHQNINPGTNMSTVSDVGEYDLPQIPLSPLSTAPDMSGARPARSWDDLRGHGRNWL